jgi:hypothetical protein
LTPFLICMHTFVTLVPAKKNTMRRAKGRFHGWTACATAVNIAATIPAGVRDLCDQARYTMTSVTGTAMTAFILSSQVESNRLRQVRSIKCIDSVVVVFCSEADEDSGKHCSMREVVVIPYPGTHGSEDLNTVLT